jgi:hypothetical protein
MMDHAVCQSKIKRSVHTGILCGSEQAAIISFYVYTVNWWFFLTGVECLLSLNVHVIQATFGLQRVKLIKLQFATNLISLLGDT